MSLKEFLKEEERLKFHKDDWMAIKEFTKDLGLFFWEDIKKDILEIDMQANKECWLFNFDNVKAYYEKELADDCLISYKWKCCLGFLGETKLKEKIRELEGKK